MSPPLLTAFLDLTNRIPLEISLRAFMGYPGLFQHAYICLFIIFHLNSKFCLHSSLTLLDPFIGSGDIEIGYLNYPKLDWDKDDVPYIKAGCAHTKLYDSFI